MGASVRRSPLTDVAVPHRPQPNGHATDKPRTAPTLSPSPVRGAHEPSQSAPQKIRVIVAAENRLLREALAKMLVKHAEIEVVGLDSAAPHHKAQEKSHDSKSTDMGSTDVASTDAGERPADILLISSRGNIAEDLHAIQQSRGCLPEVRILLIGMAKNTAEFLQCVRSGISGYLLHDASADEILEGVQAVHAGDAVCPGSLCSVLFRYFEHEAAALPCGSIRQRLGLTRREQQLIPLIAQGLTNKEIGNHFGLSEQTIKNHLYRMKHRIGAHDRLEIVQLYRIHGFLVPT